MKQLLELANDKPALDIESRAILLAVMDRIIPADTLGYPSASQNGVLGFLERQLGSDGGDLASFLPAYRLGLRAIDEEARLRLGRPFAALPAQDQDAVLSKIEEGETQGVWPVAPQQFFRLLIEHVSDGYYADPEHNTSNAGKLSWRMIGFMERTGLEGR